MNIYWTYSFSDSESITILRRFFLTMVCGEADSCMHINASRHMASFSNTSNCANVSSSQTQSSNNEYCGQFNLVLSFACIQVLKGVVSKPHGTYQIFLFIHVPFATKSLDLVLVCEFDLQWGSHRHSFTFVNL